MEIERKFILESAEQIPPDFTNYFEIRQNYLSAGDPEVRVRAEIFEHGLTDYYMTIKAGNGLKRGEVNLPIGEYKYIQLNDMCDGCSIVKQRSFIPNYRGYRTFVDRYNDFPDMPELIVAEVEFKTEEDALLFLPFEWLSTEVTNIPSLQTKNLWVRWNHTRRIG